MKEYVWCTPEIIREPQQRGNLQFTVHVVVQHTADHKRDDDSRKCMMNVLGDKVSKSVPCVSVQFENYFFCPYRLQPFKLDIIIFCLSWLDVILCSPFSRKFSSRIHLRQLTSLLLYYNKLCSYTARFKTCQDNSIFSVYACFTDHRIVSFQRLESYYFAWHLVLIMTIILVSFETFYFYILLFYRFD